MERILEWKQNIYELNNMRYANRIITSVRCVCGITAASISSVVSVLADAFTGSSESIHEKTDRSAVNAQAERMLNDYGSSVLRLAYSYLHNMSDAEEILQETLIQFLKTVPEFESREHEKAWLLHVAANLSKNRIDYNRRRDTDELNEELVSEQREDLAFVWEAVKELPDSCREAVHLFYYEGYSTEQIASILQEKEATVRSHLNRGRQKLRTILKEAYDFE